MHYKYFLLFLLFLFSFSQQVGAQKKIIIGIVKDEHTDEALPFASISFLHTNKGSTCDSAGKFTLSYNQWPSDTLVFTSVSYQDFIYVLPKNTDSIIIAVALSNNKASTEVVVKAKAKHSRGWYLWKKVLKYKNENNLFAKDNFTYQVYNKLQIDLDNVNIKKITGIKIFKPFSNTIAKNIDSISDDHPILPTFISETNSTYFFQKKPYKTKEVIIANKISGIKNESITKYLGAINQNIVIYNNFIPVFDKQFISPFNDNGDDYYNYRLADTQLINNTRFLHLVFIPKREGQNTFTGDCWIHDGSFAVQKIILHLNKEANINYVDKASIAQEFTIGKDSNWVLLKDKFYVNIHPLGKKNIGFILRKSTNYQNTEINTINVTNELQKSKLQEDIIVADDAREKENNYWDTARGEPLTKSEKGIYNMIDTIQKLPSYKKYYNSIYFLTTGYKNIGKIQIGPWFSWVSGNPLEGTRVRFDIGTTKKFNSNLYLHGYLAYGFNDFNWKQKAEALWIFNRKPRTTLHASYINDLDYSQNYHSDLQSDNFLAVAVRKTGVPIKFMSLQQTKLQLFKDTKFGLSFLVGMANKIYNPLRNLPGKELFSKTDELTATELSVNVRFAYLEKFLETNFFRYSLGSNFPIADLEYVQGIKGVLKSSYNYKKIKLNINGNISIAPFGKIDYTLFAGKVFGTLPYMLLEVHPGNELYIYNKFAFNLMNRFEFVSDKYAGFLMEHQLGNGLFRFTKITRQLKMRQFWNIKAVIGSMTAENKIKNEIGYNLLNTLDNKLYVEVGTGIDNIFKLFRIDFVWRLLPQPLPTAKASRFGIFGSFKVQL